MVKALATPLDVLADEAAVVPARPVRPASALTSTVLSVCRPELKTVVETAPLSPVTLSAEESEVELDSAWMLASASTSTLTD